MEGIAALTVANQRKVFDFPKTNLIIKRITTKIISKIALLGKVGLGSWANGKKNSRKIAKRSKPNDMAKPSENPHG